jgi:hypothetical protein
LAAYPVSLFLQLIHSCFQTQTDHASLLACTTPPPTKKCQKDMNVCYKRWIKLNIKHELNIRDELNIKHELNIRDESKIRDESI